MGGVTGATVRGVATEYRLIFGHSTGPGRAPLRSMGNHENLKNPEGFFRNLLISEAGYTSEA